MPTALSVIPKELLVQGPVHIEPGRDLWLSVDDTGAFGPDGTLPVEGSLEAAWSSLHVMTLMGREHCLAVCDAHVPGSAHGHDAYMEEAGVIPNQTLLTEELIQGWMRIGEKQILQPHAQFSLGSLLRDARLTRMFTGSDQVIWAQHAPIGGTETLFNTPIFPGLFSNIFYKGTHPIHDSHSGIWDAVGNPVGVMECMAARSKMVRRVFLGGNALEVCIMLTALNLSRFGIEVHMVMDAIGFLSFISQEHRMGIFGRLQAAGVKFSHTSQFVAA